MSAVAVRHDFDANEVFDIVAREAGAREDYRRAFVGYWDMAAPGPFEFRFMGKLGFGGKIWFNPTTPDRCPIYVSCYREDETAIRLEVMARTNAALRTLWEARLRSGEEATT